MEYIKLDGAGREVEVLLNCSREMMEIKEGGEVLFSRGFHDRLLEPGGTLIRRKNR